MLLAALVVQQHPALYDLLRVRAVDRPLAIVSDWRRGGGELQQVQRRSRVAAGCPCDERQRVWRHPHRLRPETVLHVGKRAREDGEDLLFLQSPQHKHARSRQECRVHLERRVLGRGADEDDGPRFDVREEGVLLRLVEAVNLVYEQDRALASQTPGPLGGRHDFLDVLDAGEHRAERDEARLRPLGDEPSDRRLARTRRSPEDDRLQPIALDGLPQRTPGPEHVLLPDDLIEAARPHALGERRVGPRWCGWPVVVEEIGLHEGT